MIADVFLVAFHKECTDFDETAFNCSINARNGVGYTELSYFFRKENEIVPLFDIFTEKRIQLFLSFIMYYL